MYYLQSRYYNPELCRFISADGFDYLNTEGKLNVNAYIYCWNCPAAFDDADGTTPKLSVNLTEIVSFMLMLSGESESDKASGFIEMAEKFDDLFASLKNALRIRYNSFIDKLEYFINYPDAAINSALSKVFNRNFNLKFRLLQHIREKKNISIDLSFLKADVEENDASALKARGKNSKSNGNNAVMAIFQGLVAAIELDWIDDILGFFGSSLNKLAEKSFEAVKQTSLLFITTLNTVFSYFKNSLSLDALSTFDSLILDKGEKMALESASDLIDAKGIGKGFGVFISILNFFINIDSAGSGAFTKTEDIIMNVITLVIDIASSFFGPVAGVLVPLISNIVMEVSSLRIKGLIFKY